MGVGVAVKVLEAFFSPLISAIVFSMSASEIIQIHATPEFRQRIEADVTKLNLSLSTSILYLRSRVAPEQDTARFDRHVKEVFGHHGDLMRRLAK